MHLHVYVTEMDARDAFEQSMIQGTRIMSRREIHTHSNVHRFVGSLSQETVSGIELDSATFALGVSAGVRAAVLTRVRRKEGA